MMFILRLLPKLKLLFLGLIFSSTLSAQQALLVFDNSWIRQMPPGSPTLAAYMAITNPGETEIKIKGVSSAVSKLAEIHEVSMENDLMKMRPLAELVIQPGQTVEFKQGSMHLMLLGVAKSLQEGDEVDVKFELQDLPPVVISVPVRKDS